MDKGNRFAVPLKERRDVMLQKFFENIFDVDLSDDNLIGIVRFKAGDRITIKYLDEGGLNPVQELN